MDALCRAVVRSASRNQIRGTAFQMCYSAMPIWHSTHQSERARVALPALKPHCASMWNGEQLSMQNYAKRLIKTDWSPGTSQSGDSGNRVMSGRKYSLDG